MKGRFLSLGHSFDMKVNVNQKGFTLIELLVVIAIIGLLAGIVLVSLGGARDSAQDARRQSDMRQIGTALELYYNENGTYVTGASAPTSITNFMAVVPTDPSGVSYGWVDNTSTPQSYCVWATFANGTEFFCSSEDGTAEATTAPSGLSNCCGL